MTFFGVFRIENEPVCQEHLQIATNGMYPGFSTFNMALNGFGCSVEIIVKPPTDTGGGAAGVPWEHAKDYQIIVRVSYKGKTWEETRFVSALMGKSLEKVIASLKRISIKNIAISVSSYLINIKQIFVKIKDK